MNKLRSRTIEGKHVIPVPSIEVKRNYPKIFYDKIRLLLRETHLNRRKNQQSFEKSVVRRFSKEDAYKLQNLRLPKCVRIVSAIDPEIVVKKLTIKTDLQCYRFIIVIDVPFGTQLSGKIHKLQQYIIENIERFTGILLEEVSIIIDKITQPVRKDNNNL